MAAKSDRYVCTEHGDFVCPSCKREEIAEGLPIPPLTPSQLFHVILENIDHLAPYIRARLLRSIMAFHGDDE